MRHGGLMMFTSGELGRCEAAFDDAGTLAIGYRYTVSMHRATRNIQRSSHCLWSDMDRYLRAYCTVEQLQRIGIYYTRPPRIV